MSFCPFAKFNKLFGTPNKGIHSIKFLKTSLLDYLITLLAAFLLTYLTNIPLVLTTIGALILGIIVHILFGIPTEAVKYLGFTCQNN